MNIIQVRCAVRCTSKQMEASSATNAFFKKWPSISRESLPTLLCRYDFWHFFKKDKIDELTKT